MPRLRFLIAAFAITVSALTVSAGSAAAPAALLPVTAHEPAPPVSQHWEPTWQAKLVAGLKKADDERRWYEEAARQEAERQAAAEAEARRAARAQTQASAPVYADAGGLPGGLVCIRTKESGGNYTDLSPGGRYRGAFQYSVSTWAGYGGYDDPAAAPPAIQDERALADYNRGTGQIHQNWPQTSRACGL